MNENQIIPKNENESSAPIFLSPVVSIVDALVAYQAKKDLIDKIMKPGVDYGIIPGTAKNTLLKAGAEKITSFFGLTTRFVDDVVVEDFYGDEHGGEPLIFYRRTCQLWRGNSLIAEAGGSCNSHESKYRYRNAKRVCPDCGQATIIKGKNEYGGGWVCYKKQGGCGAKFEDDAPGIVKQEVGQVLNDKVADHANTILKMADKRALIAAALIATGMSDYFTQDVEDFVIPAGVNNDEYLPTKTESELVTRYNALLKRAEAAGIDVSEWGLTDTMTHDEIIRLGIDLKNLLQEQKGD